MGKLSHAEKSFEQRLQESTNILEKYSDRVCIYIEKLERCKDLSDLDRKKYLVPKSITVVQFIYVIRSKIKVPKEKALFFYANNTIISGDTCMLEINDKYKNADGFLYIKYSSEDCFG